jgi:hypothetical protein
MRRALHVLERWSPAVVLGYALYGLFWRPRFVLWGLPSKWWYTLGGCLAVLVLVGSMLEQMDRKGR